MTKKEQMTLIKVIVENEYKNQLLNYLSDLNTVHINPRIAADIKKQAEEERNFSEKVKNLRINLNDLFNKLQISLSELNDLKIKRKMRIVFTVKDLSDLLNQVYEEINFFNNRAIELERYIIRAEIELENLNLIKSAYYFIDNFKLNRESLSIFNQLSFEVYTTFSKNLIYLKSLFEFSQIPNVYQYQHISDDRIIFYIIYPKERLSDFKERISIIHAEEVPILKKFLTSEGINFNRIFMEINLIKNNLTKYSKEQKKIKEKNLLKFSAINEIVQNIEKYHWASKQFEELSSSRLSIKFFVPLNKKQEVFSYLNESLKEHLIIESINITKGKAIKEDDEFKRKYHETEKGYSSNSKRIKQDIEEMEEKGSETEDDDVEEKDDIRGKTPTLMKNFFLFRPFETLTKLYGTPSYAEIDPTPFLFFTFPLLFGLMFGDIGHGLCLVIAGLAGAIIFRRKKGSDFYNFCWIIFWCGWGAIFVGFLYGEFFGMQEIALLGITLEPVPIYIPFLGFTTLHNPLDNIITVFIFAILVGVAHISLGWFIQFLNYIKHKRTYLAFTDSLCKIALLLGGTFLLFIWRFNINSWFSYPYPIFLTIIPGLILLFSKPMGRLFKVSYLKKESFKDLLGEGSLETFETALSVLSNVASYIRLLALALAHIALMVSIQALIGLIQGEGIGIQILIVIGLIIGNLVVILLEGILVFINAIRLHFYEFFFKFYQGTGIDFLPFYLNDRFSNVLFKVDSKKDLISEVIEKEIDTEKTKAEISKAMKYISDRFYR